MELIGSGILLWWQNKLIFIKIELTENIGTICSDFNYLFILEIFE